MTSVKEKFSCPHCNRRCLTYKRSGHFFCLSCDRSYALVSKEQIENGFWHKDETGQWIKHLG
jgi:ribosomal protein L37AE/L43A